MFLNCIFLSVVLPVRRTKQITRRFAPTRDDFASTSSAVGIAVRAPTKIHSDVISLCRRGRSVAGTSAEHAGVVETYLADERDTGKVLCSDDGDVSAEGGRYAGAS